MRTIGVGIGSNIGDRKAQITFAVAEIKKLANAPIVTSSIYKSDPWGFKSDSFFYNMVAEFECDLTNEELLAFCHRVEQAADPASHRDASGNYADRALDIDILYIDNEIIDTTELRVPHPLMQEREFVLRPLAEIRPDWRIPFSKKTVEELLADVVASQGCHTEKLCRQ